MSKHFIQSATIRRAGLAAYRLRARSQVWRKGPRVFVNSIPKAGTHLVTAELAKAKGLQNSYLHLDNRRFSNSSSSADSSGGINVAVIEKDLRTVRPGQYFSGHVAWDPALEEMLRRNAVKTIFVTRDPRAVLVSRYNYILGLKRHWLHEFLTGYSSDPVERYRLLINGHDGTPSIRPSHDRLEAYLPWIESSCAHTVRFEDLVGARGGRSDELKQETLRGMLTFAGYPDDAPDAAEIGKATTSATFRKGQADSWREELPPQIVTLVDETSGEIIERMGYPRVR